MRAPPFLVVGKWKNTSCLTVSNDAMCKAICEALDHNSLYHSSSIDVEYQRDEDVWSAEVHVRFDGDNEQALELLVCDEIKIEEE